MNPLTESAWLVPAFFAVAVVYASVGFGGGSSYLALLVLAGLSHTVVPPAALACNLAVSAGGVWHFHRRGALDVSRVAPFVVLSVPMAAVGGAIPVGRTLFSALLGLSLLAAGARVFVSEPAVRPRAWSRRRIWRVGVPAGGALGLLSGLVGIGGGVFLAPLLLLGGIADARATAGASALFIFVNSAAALAVHAGRAGTPGPWLVPLIAAVVAGGQIGSRLGARRLPLGVLRRALGALILLVSVRVLWTLT